MAKVRFFNLYENQLLCLACVIAAYFVKLVRVLDSLNGQACHTGCCAVERSALISLVNYAPCASDTMQIGNRN